MTISTKKQKGYYIISLQGTIKTGLEFDLDEEFNTIIKNNEFPKIIINLKNVVFLNLACINFFINVFKVLELSNPKKGRLYFCNVPDNIYRVFNIMNVEKILNIHDKIEHVLEEGE